MSEDLKGTGSRDNIFLQECILYTPRSKYSKKFLLVFRFLDGPLITRGESLQMQAEVPRTIHY